MKPGPCSGCPVPPDCPGTRVATRKLIHALPESLRAEAETLAITIHYDHASWGEVRAPDPGSSGKHVPTNDAGKDETAEEAEEAGDADNEDYLETLRSALIQHRSVHITYTRSNGHTSERVVRPLGLVAMVGRWYLVARRESAHGEDVRTYRVDRIDTINIAQNSPAPDTHEFDLVAYWDEHIKQIEEFRSSVTGTIRAPLWTRPILQDHFGSYMTVISAEGESTPEGQFHRRGAGQSHCRPCRAAGRVGPPDRSSRSTTTAP